MCITPASYRLLYPLEPQSDATTSKVPGALVKKPQATCLRTKVPGRYIVRGLDNLGPVLIDLSYSANNMALYSP